MHKVNHPRCGSALSLSLSLSLSDVPAPSSTHACTYVHRTHCSSGRLSLPLQRLNLAGCNVTSAAVEALVKCARRLVSLRLSRCLNRQARCLDHRLILLTKLEFLEHLDISLTACLSDAVVWQLLAKLERLRSLNLASCDGLSDDAFVACRVASSHLCSLDVRYASYGSFLPVC